MLFLLSWTWHLSGVSSHDLPPSHCGASTCCSSPCQDHPLPLCPPVSMSPYNYSFINLSLPPVYKHVQVSPLKKRNKMKIPLSLRSRGQPPFHFISLHVKLEPHKGRVCTQCLNSYNFNSLNMLLPASSLSQYPLQNDTPYGAILELRPKKNL